MKKLIPRLEKGIRLFAYSVLVLMILNVIAAFFDNGTSHEASIGEFHTIDFNNGWNVWVNEEALGVKELPCSVPSKPKDIVTLKNNLPDNLSDGMSITIRTSLQDAYIYIDGEERTSYATENFDNMTEYLPSAYVVLPLNADDAGKEIEIRLTVKVSSLLNKINIGYGNNSWFSVIKAHIPMAVTSIFVILLGSFVIIAYPIIARKFQISNSIFYLGLLMDVIGIWLLSESKLRQLIFVRPSLTSVFAYLSVELIGIFTLLYFDEIQHKIHHKIYMLMGFILSLQLSLNMILNYAGIQDYYETLKFSHAWLVLGIFIIVINIINDLIHKRILSYKIVVIGMGFFLFFGVLEIYLFYFASNYNFGPSLCIGLMLLLFTNIIQIISDVISEFTLNEKKKQETWINTIETIASAIDAKDEYTGGHSERVATYAGMLAKELAEEYNFSENDILRIRYIGLMHDIGKIGVTDDILNNSGKLTSEEYSLMKKHVEIGNVLMAHVGHDTKGLLDGIRHHHERYDGTGYPDGLKGEEIPLISRILCLSDSYDAMTSNRIYRRRLTDKEVKDEIIRCSGTQFDPKLVKVFIKLLDEGIIYPLPLSHLKKTNEEKLLPSNILENLLQKDRESGTESIMNPSHVRLACYIMKLAELNNQSFDAIFIEPKISMNNEMSKTVFLEDSMIPYMLTKDINIHYTENKNLVVLFGRSNQELKEIIDEISNKVNVTFLSQINTL